jgi:DNA-binding FrmR family transcriptional regulator
MAHTLEEKKRLLNRVRRIMGQVAAIEKALDQEAECSDVLHNISACRGAMDALMAEVIEVTSGSTFWPRMDRPRTSRCAPPTIWSVLSAPT